MSFYTKHQTDLAESLLSRSVTYWRKREQAFCLEARETALHQFGRIIESFPDDLKFTFSFKRKLIRSSRYTLGKIASELAKSSEGSK